VPSASDDDQMGVVIADIKIDGSTIFVTFLEAEEWPFEIENECGYTVSICQWVNYFTRDAVPVLTLF
jgi:vacuolar protein sorting-associated protein 13A/C